MITSIGPASAEERRKARWKRRTRDCETGVTRRTYPGSRGNAFAGAPGSASDRIRSYAPSSEGALFGKMIARALLGVAVLTCGFAADAENQVTNERRKKP